MRRFLNFYLLFFTIFLSCPQSAYPVVINFKLPINDGSVPAPGVVLPMTTNTEYTICQYRRLLCGKIGLVLVAVAVFTIGILVMIEKISWGAVIGLSIGAIVFYYADDIARGFGETNFILLSENPLCNCNCKIDPFDFTQQDLQDCIDTMKISGQIENN